MMIWTRIAVVVVLAKAALQAGRGNGYRQA